jgi:hypothetical protein
MGKVIRISEGQLKKIIKENSGTYMVLSNLVNLKNNIETILSFKHHPDFDKLITGEHAWAGDHITTSKDDIEEVANFMVGYYEEKNLTESNIDDLNPRSVKSLKKISSKINRFGHNWGIEKDNRTWPDIDGPDTRDEKEVLVGKNRDERIVSINHRIHEYLNLIDIVINKVKSGNYKEGLTWDKKKYTYSDEIEGYKKEIDRLKEIRKKYIEAKNLSESEMEIDESKNKPTNPKLWSSCLAWARSRYKVCPSAYCNGAAAKRYKSKGGGWRTVK